MKRYWCPCKKGKSLFFLTGHRVNGDALCIYRCLKCDQDYLALPKGHKNDKELIIIDVKKKGGFGKN